MLFSKMNLKAIVLGVVGLASFAAAQDDVPTLSLESNTFKEGGGWQFVKIILSEPSNTTVSFSFCFELNSDIEAEGNFAEKADLSDDDTENGYTIPVCSSDQLGISSISAGETETFAYINPLKDNTVEKKEKLWLKIIELSGANLAEDYETDKGFSILIADENWAPSVENQQFSIPEKINDGSDWETGKTVGTVKASDLNNDQLTYKVVTEGVPFDFKYQELGELVLTDGSALDYETRSSWVFDISVSDGHGGSDTVTITVDLMDVNEAPAFKNESYEFEIAENTTADITTLIGAVEAVDPDIYSASFSQLTYSLEEGGDADLFTLDPFSHEITYKDGTVFDFETKSSYEFNVSVTDGSFTATVPVKVKVTDVNEEPEFAKTSYEFTVTENSDVKNFAECVVAVDPDVSAECGTLIYSLDGDDAESFVIDESTGVITAKDNVTFDYEAMAFYSFSVVVTDGLYTKSVPIVISVTDVNEEPKFANESYDFVVAENDALAFLVSVAAEDPDANIDYASLTYSIEKEESGLFEINKSSGDIYASEGASFDYETKSSYSFEVVVSDGEFENRVPVTVNVTNVDEAPIFPNGLTTVFYVDEDAIVGKLVGIVPATDDDCKGDFSETCAKPTYSLSPFVGSEANADAFTIDDSGNIKLAGTLDYDTKSVYEYHVIVTDGENAELSSSIDVTINVFNITNKPTITDDGKAGYDVTEFASTDMVIACYVVDDKDLSQVAKLKPSLKDLGNTKAGDLFGATINRDGSAYKLCLVVKNGDKLDYEKIAHTHKVEISVTDPDLLSASLTKTINITDVNEKPSISGSLTHAFYEHEGKNHMVGQLSVEDPDTSKAFTNNVFAIVAGDTALFSITENGLIKTKRDFDFEKETRYVYNVSVTLSDKDSKNYPTYKDTAVVQITLKDSPNDPVSSSSSKPASSSSSKPSSSSSKANVASSSSKVYVASSSSQFVVEPESSASSSNSNASEYAAPTFRVKMCAPFEFEIIMTEFSPSLAKQYAVMDMMGHVLSAGELSDGSARVTVPTRGAYVVRVGLGYKRVNVK